MARTKKEQEKQSEKLIEKMSKPMYQLVDPIDRLPKIDYDKADIISLVEEEKTEIDSFRTEWYERKFDYLRQWDDYLDYPQSYEILKGQKNVHIPVTHEKLQAWHARVYKSIFAVDPIFSCEPLNLVHKNEVEAVKLVLRWYLRNEINYGQGLKPFVDELLWDLGTDGWAIAYKRWETIQRRMVDLQKINRDVAREEMLMALGELKNKGKITKNYKEIERIVTVFSGVVLETVPHECVYFQDYIPTSGNLNYPNLVMVERLYTQDQIETMIESGFFDREAGTKILEKGKGGFEAKKQELQRERERLQGVRENDYRNKDMYSLYTAFLRTDIDGEGYPQEYIFSVSLKAKEVARATYLDRVCRDGNRPVYKFDLIKRPRSSYSRGLVELLYPLNQEVDEFHNFRRAAGKIANIPWGFYRAGSGLEKESIVVEPGKFFPVDDPQTDVKPMIFGNVTSWALQEESLALTYADKVTSMPPMMQGQVPQMVGPLRSTSGVMALMNEAQAPLDVYLDRIRIPFGQMLSGVLSDIQMRLPHTIKVLVLGDKGELLYDSAGNVLTQDVTQQQISAKYRFTLAANDAQYNPEKDRQNALAMLQLGLSAFPVQMGLTTPENAYHLLKDVYEKNGTRDVSKYLTTPQMTTKPMNLYQEYVSCLNGMMPVIVINDDHVSKMTGLTMLAKSPEYMEAKTKGVVSPLSDALLNQAIVLHGKYQQMIESLQQMQVQEGLNVPTTIGARSTGAANAQGEMAQGGQSERERGVQGTGGASPMENRGTAGATPAA